MGKYNFVADLKNSKASVIESAELLIDAYNAEILDLNDTKDYDIRAEINGHEYLFEVKEDFMCGDTNNVALEYHSRGKPSGISTTNAHYYIYKLHTKDRIRYILLDVKKIKKSIEDEVYFREVNGGDWGSNTLCYLYKLDKFMKLGWELRGQNGL